MPFKLWFYLGKICVPLLFATLFVGFLLPDDGIGHTLIVAAFLCLLPLGLIGAVMGFLWTHGRLRMRCPFCGRSGPADACKGGMCMKCEACGFIDGTGRFRLKLIKDPTAHWRPFTPPIPDFDLTEMRFGPLRLGDPIDSAASLGRPDDVQWSPGEPFELLYAAGGFQMDIDSGKLAYLAFFIAPDAHQPKHPALAFSTPRLRGPGALRLSSDTTRSTIEQLLGPPDSADTDPDETILYYSRQKTTMEFEIDGKTGKLKRWNLYPKTAAP